MSYKLSFGMFEGKTFEWIFFKAPWYAQYIHENAIDRQPHSMDEEEGKYFRRLYRRANNLLGVCSICHKQPVHRMGLSTHRGTGALGAVGFYCEDCEYQGGTPTGYYQPSFFVEAYDLPRCEQLRITGEIKKHYIGEGNLTQKKMEAFFTKEANFDLEQPAPKFLGALVVAK